MKRKGLLKGLAVLLCLGAVLFAACETPTNAEDQYTVSYQVNGGTGTPPAAQTVPAGDSITVAEGGGLSKTGYAFSGWSTDASGKGTAYNPGFSLTVNADTTLYARWVQQYTVSYLANGADEGGGTPLSTQTVTAGDSIIIADGSGLSKAGFVFSGWDTKDSGDGIVYSPGASLAVIADTTLYARWVVSGTQYTVSYHINDGSGTPPVSKTVTVGDAPITVADNSSLSRTGYTFNGWNTNLSGTGTAYSSGSSLTVSADTVLYAQWVKITQYTVSYHANGGGGTPPAAQTVTVGGSIAVADQGGLTRTGHTFSGWNTSDSGDGTAYNPGSSLTVNADITLYAQWINPSKQCTVRYDANNGSGTLPSMQTVAAGTRITVADRVDLTRPGYAFIGWNTSGSGMEAIYAFGVSLTVNANITLYAQWAILPPDSLSLADALTWIAARAEIGDAYAVTVWRDETISPTTLFYDSKNVHITIRGDDAERKISLNKNGSAFTVGSKVTLTLGNNITLRGRSGNNTALVSVNSGGALIMSDGSKITGNTANTANTASSGGGVHVNSGTFTMQGGEIAGNTASYYGGGVLVSSGTFTMQGGEIAGNTASFGGGVAVASGTFSKTGGIMYGSDASSVTLRNTAGDDVQGHAVYVISIPVKIRNSTAGTGVNLNSGTAANWAGPFALDGRVSITSDGSPAVDGVVTADIGSLLGTTEPSYSWQRGDTSTGEFTAIPGATGASYTLTFADWDKYIQVQVIRTGYTGSKTSSVIGPIEPAVLEGTVSISSNYGGYYYEGIFAVGESETAALGSLKGTGTPAYSWQRGDSATGTFSAISGATDASYTLTAADVGKYIQVQVSRYGYTGSKTSAARGPVIPVLEGTVSISAKGNPTVNDVVTADTGALQGTGTPSYIWQRGDSATGIFSAISGATGASYTLTAVDHGKYIKVEVSRAGYAGSKTSGAMGPVLSILEGTVSITTDGSPTVSEVVKADTGALQGTGTPAYSWQRGDSTTGIFSAISGATGASYTLTAADGGKYIAVQVSRYGYTGDKTSAAIGPVLFVLEGTVSISAKGNPTVNDVVTADISALQGTGVLAYSWQRGSTRTGTFTPISGATGASYTLVTADKGTYIKVQVSRAGYAGDQTSNAIGPIGVLEEILKRDMVNAATGQVTIEGNAAYGSGAFSAGSTVTLSPFAIGKYEVTYELWCTVYQWATSTDRGANKYTIANRGREGNDGTDGAVPTGAAKYEPVTYISWRDVIVWCNAYSEMAGKAPVYYKADGTTILRESTVADQAVIKGWPGSVPNGYRLPTEAEWEYAARGGGTTPETYTYAGSDTAGNVAWTYENSSSGTRPVGGKAANSLGLYDMSGNVWEWCWDWYGSISSGAATNPPGPATGSNRVIRGGGWSNIAGSAAVASRLNVYPSDRSDGIGFRVVCPLVP